VYIIVNRKTNYNYYEGASPPHNLIITHIYLVWTQNSGFCRAWQFPPGSLRASFYRLAWQSRAFNTM